jgi:all-trans-retinol 13,14-reductase
VISDAGAANTYRRLLGPEHAAPVERQALEAIGPSESYACLYLGFRHSDAELGLDGTNLWLYPGGSHDENVDAYRADAARALPMIYVSFPSAKDPAWAQQHPGRATVEVISLCPWDSIAPWEATRWGRRPADYAAFKQQLTERLIQALFAARPQLRGKVDHAELSTPLSVRHFAGHPRGELYGLAHNPARIAHGLSAQTSVPGLLLTGADLVTGGIAGALTGGALCACAVLGPTLLQSLFARGR